MVIALKGKQVLHVNAITNGLNPKFVNIVQVRSFGVAIQSQQLFKNSFTVLW